MEKTNSNSGKRPHLFYIIVVVISIILFKLAEVLTGFPFDYFDALTLTGNLLHILMFILVYFMVYAVLNNIWKQE